MIAKRYGTKLLEAMLEMKTAQNKNAPFENKTQFVSLLLVIACKGTVFTVFTAGDSGHSGHLQLHQSAHWVQDKLSILSLLVQRDAMGAVMWSLHRIKD